MYSHSEMPNQNYNLTNYPVAPAVFFRSYSRQNDRSEYESWEESVTRAIDGLVKLGKVEPKDAKLMREQALNCQSLPSGRWMWCGGSEWISKQENFYGGYNCTSNELDDPRMFGLLMNLAMQGCGTGAILEERCISKLPKVITKMNLRVIGDFHDEGGDENTLTYYDSLKSNLRVVVGDSRKGWCDAYQRVIDLGFSGIDGGTRGVSIEIDISNVRRPGKKLKGFGGTSNPSKLPELFPKIADIINAAYGRYLTAEECCLLIDEAALVVVAGNIRRSAAIKQFDRDYPQLKNNLWIQDNEGNWKIDPKRDALRMSNHTRVYHTKPTLEECLSAVRTQFKSGEGAIQYVNEAIARANSDIFRDRFNQVHFINNLDSGLGAEHLKLMRVPEKEIDHRLYRYGLNPCGEIIGKNYFCNLSEIHINRIDGLDLREQVKAFESGALSVAILLNHEFDNERWRYSRELDPIVGVSITGLFDFFVNLFGRDWLVWWQSGRSNDFDSELSKLDRELIRMFECDISIQNMAWSYQDTPKKSYFFRTIEREYLKLWKKTVFNKVEEYCKEQGLKVPNRCTTIQPAGSKSLLSNASPGWHPPKASRYIRRVTFRKDDPVALTLRDMGFNLVPSQSDKDESGNLLNDPYDSRCTEWLVEIPVKTPWADIAEGIDISKFSALAQFDFYMQVQTYYTTHNTSATIELREDEIEPLATRIYEAIRDNEGYISAALLARFDTSETFPRLPFEPISKEKFKLLSNEVEMRKLISNDDFVSTLNKYAIGRVAELSPSGCDSDACMLPEKK